LDTPAGGLPLLLVERTLGHPVQATASAGRMLFLVAALTEVDRHQV
jgi:hypothetical protein